MTTSMRLVVLYACAALIAVVAVVAVPGCGPSVDVAAALRLESVTTGWVDVGAPGGSSTRVVPSVTLTVKNTSDSTLAPVQVNAVFHRVGETSEWGNGLVVAAGSAGLSPSAASGRLVIMSGVGYTGTDSTWDLLQNSHFVDATVDVFGRYGSRQWVRLGAFPVARQIIER